MKPMVGDEYIVQLLETHRMNHDRITIDWTPTGAPPGISWASRLRSPLMSPMTRGKATYPSIMGTLLLPMWAVFQKHRGHQATCLILSESEASPFRVHNPRGGRAEWVPLTGVSNCATLDVPPFPAENFFFRMGLLEPKEVFHA
jgi:hypothetical protein